MERYKDFLLIEVPEIAKNISISNYDHGLVIDFDIANQYHSIELPSGNYTIVGKVSEIYEKDLSEDIWQWISKTITEKNLSSSTTLIIKING